MEAAFTGYSTGLHGYIHTSNPESNPLFHYYYHSYDPFLGRRYHFHHGAHLEQSNLVRSAMGMQYNPNEFLDRENYLSSDLFLGYVWLNGFEIGGKLTEIQKSKIFCLD